MYVKEVKEYLDRRFPITDAEEFDQKSIGLAIGSEKIEVKNIMLTLDLTKEVVMEAIKNDCNLIISHHPFLYMSINKVLFESEKGEVIGLMFEHKISLYSIHTNLDVASGGVNDTLAELLGIEDIKVINNEYGKGNYLRYGNINPIKMIDLAKNVKNIFNLSGVKVLGDLDRSIRTIGVVGGSGAHLSDIMSAVEAGCDCYITGEIDLNVGQTAAFYGLSLIEVNHGVEKFVFVSLIEELKNQFKELYNYNYKIMISTIETDKMIMI